MQARVVFRAAALIVALTSCLLSACSALAVPPTVVPTPAATSDPGRPEWFTIPLTDVRTGQTFTINDLAGKVVLIQTMVQWCSNCAYQQREVTLMRTMLGQRDDLVSISLDVDLNEDAASLKKYVDYFGFDWHFAVAPLEVTRALGNLYSAVYLNAPLEPMLLIDRSGNVYGLPYGFKDANALSNTLGPFLQ